MQKRPIILISNDDSIEAQGIQYLTELMKTFADVYVVAHSNISREWHTP